MSYLSSKANSADYHDDVHFVAICKLSNCKNKIFLNWVLRKNLKEFFFIVFISKRHPFMVWINKYSHSMRGDRWLKGVPYPFDLIWKVETIENFEKEGKNRNAMLS